MIKCRYCGEELESMANEHHLCVKKEFVKWKGKFKGYKSPDKAYKDFLKKGVLHGTKRHN